MSQMTASHRGKFVDCHSRAIYAIKDGVVFVEVKTDGLILDSTTRKYRLPVCDANTTEGQLVLLALQLQCGEIGLEVYSAVVQAELAKVGR